MLDNCPATGPKTHRQTATENGLGRYLSCQSKSAVVAHSQMDIKVSGSEINLTSAPPRVLLLCMLNDWY